MRIGDSSGQASQNRSAANSRVTRTLRDEAEDVLVQWREKALPVALLVIVLVGLPAYASSFVNAVQSGQVNWLVGLYLAVYLACIGLAFAPRLDFRVRAWGLIALGYANGTASFLRLGLAGSGRLYLIVFPILAILLLGLRAGYIATAASLGLFVLMTLLVQSGALRDWLVIQSNPVDLGFWIEAGTAFAVFLALATASLSSFYSLLLNAIAARRRASAELEQMSVSLYETTLGIMSRLDTTELLEAIVGRATELVDCSYGWVYLVTPDKHAMEVRVGTGFFHQYVGLELKRGEGLAGAIWQNGEPMAIEDYQAWSGRSSHFQGDPVGPAIGVPLKSGSEVVGAIGLTRPPGAIIFSSNELSLMARFAQLASIALENARLHTSLQEEQLALQAAYENSQRRVQERTRELATLNAIAGAASCLLDITRIMEEALEETIRVMNLDFGVASQLVGEIDRAPGCRSTPLPNAQEAACELLERVVSSRTHGLPPPPDVAPIELVPLVYRGVSEEYLKSVGQHPLNGIDIAIAARIGEPFVFLVEEGILDSELKLALNREQVCQVISVPVMAQGKLVGAMNLGARNPRTLDPEQLSLLSAIGQQVGIAIENARLRAQAEQVATVSERSRLARELHDSVTQSLYSVTLYTEAATRLLNSGRTAEAAAHLRDVRQTARDALLEMRLLIFQLRPPALENSSLSSALQGRLDAVESRGGVQAVLDVWGEEQIARSFQEELYHIAQEALNNALKHARARRVEVRLRFEPEMTCLEVWDDGTGFEPEVARLSGGFGISGMNERAAKIGGSLVIESVPGKGTRVRVQVPVQTSINGGSK